MGPRVAVASNAAAAMHRRILIGFLQFELIGYSRAVEDRDV